MGHEPVNRSSELSNSAYKLGQDSVHQPGVPKGTVQKRRLEDCSIYPGSAHDFWVYVPDQYQDSEPACVMCFHGGVSIGLAGETVSCVRVDDMDLRDIGFMHIDAQGAEPHILHSARKVLARDRPVVFFEDNRRHDTKLHDRVCEAEPDFIEESQFDAINHCLNGLGYKTDIEQFNGGIDVLLAP